MRRMGDVKRTRMNWRLPAIGLGFALLTLAALTLLSESFGKGVGVVAAVLLIVATAALLLLDRIRK